ncbi:hypothetical protein Kfla_4921 [Kribbella flavida DSM 17836]|uniref:Uncharacterized protein n=1 Tax=Kribbella flavida (strain DSM 17836 / JCM 10339 / NBRC 14399) TaxID=479435 RepID=D2Q1Z1_KRIFD|nr:hypothetical protein [Kribbella flavida]ADB33937.1 hypothetical protein Kfla_4921 [Kribbella flavida DSM 17836]
MVRVEVRSPRRLMIGLLLSALVCLCGAGLVTWDIKAQSPQEERLRQDGQIVSGRVVDITKQGRLGIAREVRVELDDGRVIEVDLSERPSNVGIGSGSTLSLLVDPRDPANNRPVDAPPSSARWWTAVAPLIAMACGALVACFLVNRAFPKAMNWSAGRHQVD